MKLTSTIIFSYEARRGRDKEKSIEDFSANLEYQNPAAKLDEDEEKGNTD